MLNFKIKLLLLLSLLGTFVHAEPIQINPTHPPSATVLDREKMRLNFLQIRIDQVAKSHATLVEADRVFNDELLVEVKEILTKYIAWNEELFLVKNILADIDLLTTTQEAAYKQKILTLMSDLYDIKMQSNNLRSRINNVSREVYLVAEYAGDFISTEDYTNFPEGENAFAELKAYRQDLLDSLGKLFEAIGTELEDKMTGSINATKEIVDELLLIRSLDYPELEGKLLELKEYTHFSIFMEPIYAEVRWYKSGVSSALDEYRPFRSVDLFESMKIRGEELKEQIENSDFSQAKKTIAKNYVDNEIIEAGKFVEDESLVPLYVADRYEQLQYVKQICSDPTDYRYPNFNCGLLPTIMGIDRSKLLKAGDGILRHIEVQMDRIAKGVMGND